MFKTHDIYSISDFTRNSRDHADRLRATRRPEILTVNGTAELVVQNADAYQELLDRLDEFQTLRALDEAADEIDRGDGVDATEMMTRLRERLGVRERAR